MHPLTKRLTAAEAGSPILHKHRAEHVWSRHATYADYVLHALHTLAPLSRPLALSPRPSRAFAATAAAVFCAGVLRTA
ncbi:hypothetical protein DFH11DRAFT_1746564, partial [Phellopilus nigrolimitatus]